jgi:ribosomal-protein-alanine N-acetyltransferase
LILKRLEASDVEPLIELWSDPDATRYLGGPRERTGLQAELEKSVQDPFAERYDLWAVVEKGTGRVIGHCGLLEKDVEGRPEIELNYIISPSRWGEGLATEIADALKQYAFTQMGIQRLIALIEPGNAASERVAVKVGMHFEKEIIRPGGHLRKVFLLETKT